MSSKRKLTKVAPPSPIINRHTGHATHFGNRRAFDGAYALELINASGCTSDEAATVKLVLKPLFENCGHITIEQLLMLLSIYSPYAIPTPAPRLTVVDLGPLAERF